MELRRFPQVLAVLILVSFACSFPRSTSPPAVDPTAQTAALLDGALLNEVLFSPSSGAPAFIELKSPAGRVALDGLVLVNERGEIYSLPEGSGELSAGEFFLILFDGTNLVEDGTVHADAGGFLNPVSGFIELHAPDQALLDRVAWGADQPASVKLDRGGVIGDLEPGTTIGRFPGSIRPDPLEWTVFSPGQTTPGAANPQPGVAVMIPLNGAVVSQTRFDLSWYPAPGAAQYRVQVAGDEAFNGLILDEAVDSSSLNVELAAGKYFWRVQAVAEDGQPADFSAVQSVAVRPVSASMGRLAAPGRQNNLSVPLISQHKDTRMILLESKNETGVHAWDVDHGHLDRSDPADNANCALASIAMINAFHGGDLSQDRIGFEVLKDLFPGPEYDLMYGRGLYADEISQGLAFALEGEVVYRPRPESLDAFWADIQLGIDAGAPVLAAQFPGHAFVITGYHEEDGLRYVTINDPWWAEWGPYSIDIGSIPWKYYWLTSPDSIPTVNDPEIAMDSDGDGIVDFDEINRFGTSPSDEDYDQDNLNDKEDLRASIYDEQWGYAVAALSFFGRDYDRDGIKMELDPDSDGGGCFDGMEDFDLDGKYNGTETWNFDENDDACFFGTDELVLDTTKVYDDGGSHHQRLRTFVTFSLHAVEGGKLEGLAQVYYTHTGEFFSDLCSGTHTIGDRFFQATLDGEFQKLEDDSTLVTFRSTPDHGEPYFVQWNTSCPADDEEWQGWYWGGQSGTLADGVYDYFQDFSSVLVGETGEFWQKVHMEQGEGLE